VSELADRAHVSKPTVVRFCRSVGYDGSGRLQAQAGRQRCSEGVPFVHRSVDEDDKPNDIIVKVIDNTGQRLCLEYRNDASQRGLRARHRRRWWPPAASGTRIEFYGVGNSGIVAQDAQHKFFRLGVHAVACSDGHVQVMKRHACCDPGDCAVVISNSGRSRDLMDACDIAHANGATTIVITASGSPLAHTRRPSTSCWRRTTPKTSTATAPWCRACCT